jgi:hypothetical protein
MPSWKVPNRWPELARARRRRRDVAALLIDIDGDAWARAVVVEILCVTAA